MIMLTFEAGVNLDAIDNRINDTGRIIIPVTDFMEQNKPLSKQSYEDIIAENFPFMNNI